jgi:hypothetical protein
VRTDPSKGISGNLFDSYDTETFATDGEVVN